MLRKATIALVGFGNVGTGVVQILLEQRRQLRERVDLDLDLRWVVDADLGRRRPVRVPKALLTDKREQALTDPCVDIVVELVGGTGVAKDIVLEALRNGKSVVTANKALLAVHGEELFREARRRGLSISYEASVGGGIPIIGAIRDGLVGNRIDAIEGILNGTSNYILTRMSEEGASYDEALAEARRHGYAEPDPHLDVSGMDAAHKLVILARLGFGLRDVRLRNVSVEGIAHIDREDVRNAGDLGYAVKLLAIGKRRGGAVELRVHPTLIPQNNPLASVRGIFNSIIVMASNAGETMYYGRGAGRLPTASAVVADIVDVALGRARFTFEALYSREATREARVVPMADVVSRYYLRIPVVDRAGALARISAVLGRHGVSIASVVQREHTRRVVPVVMMSHAVREGDLRKALTHLERLPVVKGKPLYYRVEG
ncbi:MAG: homoserine dehydrogenase [Planctomycetota bacterium]